MYLFTKKNTGNITMNMYRTFLKPYFISQTAKFIFQHSKKHFYHYLKYTWHLTFLLIESADDKRFWNQIKSENYTNRNNKIKKWRFQPTTFCTLSYNFNWKSPNGDFWANLAAKVPHLRSMRRISKNWCLNRRKRNQFWYFERTFPYVLLDFFSVQIRLNLRVVIVR